MVVGYHHFRKPPCSFVIPLFLGGTWSVPGRLNSPDHNMHGNCTSWKFSRWWVVFFMLLIWPHYHISLTSIFLNQEISLTFHHHWGEIGVASVARIWPNVYVRGQWGALWLYWIPYRIHVRYICLHVVDGKCREIYHTWSCRKRMKFVQKQRFISKFFEGPWKPFV